jgi:hypothetical protein
MTREDIKRMASISEVYMYGIGAKYQGLDASEGFINRLEHFANLVAKQEREACVKAIEDQIGWDMDDPESTAIQAIRAKGQA